MPVVYPQKYQLLLKSLNLVYNVIMDDELRGLIRQAGQQDDIETNLRVLYGLERSGDLAAVMHQMEHLPSFPFRVIYYRYQDGEHEVRYRIQPVNFKRVFILPANSDGSLQFPWYQPPVIPLSRQVKDPYVFSLYSLADIQKFYPQGESPNMVASWGSQRELYWLPLHLSRREGAEWLYKNPPIPRIAFQNAGGLFRDFSDAIDTWVADNHPEMEAANRRWNLYQIALEMEPYRAALEALKKQEAGLSQKISNWIHNRW